MAVHRYYSVILAGQGKLEEFDHLGAKAVDVHVRVVVPAIPVCRAREIVQVMASSDPGTLHDFIVQSSTSFVI